MKRSPNRPPDDSPAAQALQLVLTQLVDEGYIEVVGVNELGDVVYQRCMADTDEVPF